MVVAILLRLPLTLLLCLGCSHSSASLEEGDPDRVGEFLSFVRLIVLLALRLGVLLRPTLAVLPVAVALML